MRADGAPVSGVSTGLEEWDKSAPLSGNLKYQKIIERRLCKKLGKKYFRLPPVLEKDATRPDGTPDLSSLVLRRFPEWLQCPSCEMLRPAGRWGQDPGKAYRFCPKCSNDRPGGAKVFAIPVRFAAACTAGHLDDFPWNWWVGHKEGCANRNELKLSSVGPGLAGLLLSCPTCNQSRSMDGAFGEKALKELSCKGSRPWLRTNSNGCGCNGNVGTFRAVQRGASNLYYPVMESALDIPPWTRSLERIIGDFWDVLLDITSLEGRIRYIESSEQLSRILARERIPPRELAERFEKMVNDADEIDTSNLRLDEYKVLTNTVDEDEGEFEIHREAVPPSLVSRVSCVVRVARLREVRVVRAFTRINPPFDGEGEVAPISESALDWLPAIEVRGEGVFIQLDQNEVLQWEQREDVKQRVHPAKESWIRDWSRRYPDKPIPYEASPRLLMIHAFAHALIRQLTLECGYSTASLRERLYVSEGVDGMTGVLIYTATSDSDGTLGGLQRRALPHLLGPTIEGALRSVQWCSSDPLCIEGEMAAPETHSIAACHSCLLVPETSCELHNRFLDRALLIGSGDGAMPGYFHTCLARTDRWQ
ncbi:hypothetical protein C2134_02615 [Chromobacterium sinusclupearum]|uniref:MrfA-like Zn-binding domain-containing protein n=2 Tax=Chromobacterium sinusclupearum TaxID=2077146 RepID=A0A2K4MTL5_9NEIS|nr:hypothetical protein C2134_02615 [Chromobacterium sinusclupearum]